MIGWIIAWLKPDFWVVDRLYKFHERNENPWDYPPWKMLRRKDEVFEAEEAERWRQKNIKTSER